MRCLILGRWDYEWNLMGLNNISEGAQYDLIFINELIPSS